MQESYEVEQAGQGDTSTRDASTALTTERKEGGASDKLGGAVFVDILPIRQKRHLSHHRQSNHIVMSHSILPSIVFSLPAAYISYTFIFILCLIFRPAKVNELTVG